jgi:SpoVK/Ycf46/Vps4 family AAA+-type ATPase
MPKDKQIEEGIEVIPNPVRNNPMRTDLFGKAGEFVDGIREDINNEALYSVMGTISDKTYLLYGPPGTGKTMALNVLNNEMNKGVLLSLSQKTQGEISSVPLADFGLLCFRYDIGKYGTAYINMGSRRVQEFFDKVGLYAQLGTKVLIEMDECDSLFMSRTSHVQTHSEDRKVLETIMKNMQIVHDTPNIYLVAMTNLPEICDDATLRSGRIDRKIKFDLPGYDERVHAFEQSIEALNQRAYYKVIRGAKPKVLAEMSEKFNYADINTVVDRAVKERARIYARENPNTLAKLAFVSQNMLEKALLDVKDTSKTKPKTKIGF